MTDRITYSYSLKVPGAADFSSVGVSMSLETDVRPGETVEQAAARARAFCQEQCERDMPPGAGCQSTVDNEVFDIANPVHCRIADAIFDTEKVSDSQRSFMMRNKLRGVRIGDLATTIRQDLEEFRRRAGGDKRSTSGQGGAWPRQEQAKPFLVGRRDGTKSNWDGGRR